MPAGSVLQLLGMPAGVLAEYALLRWFGNDLGSPTALGTGRSDDHPAKFTTPSVRPGWTYPPAVSLVGSAGGPAGYQAAQPTGTPPSLAAIPADASAAALAALLQPARAPARAALAPVTGGGGSGSAPAKAAAAADTGVTGAYKVVWDPLPPTPPPPPAPPNPPGGGGGGGGGTQPPPSQPSNYPPAPPYISVSGTVRAAGPGQPKLSVWGYGTPGRTFALSMDGLPRGVGHVAANGYWTMNLPCPSLGAHQLSAQLLGDGRHVLPPGGFFTAHVYPLASQDVMPQYPPRPAGHGQPPGQGELPPGSGGGGSAAARSVGPASIPLGQNIWTPVGPAPILKGQTPGAEPVSGRLVAVSASPTDANTIYVAAAGGGVWRTTDGGTTWTPLTDGQATLYMGALTVAPSDPTVYAGTGEATNGTFSYYGRGMLKSTDGGATWTLLDQTDFDRRTFAAIAVDPTNASNVYAAVADNATGGLTGNVGIWHTTDGGATWTNTTVGKISNLTTVSSFSDVKLDPTNPQTVYAAVGDLTGVAQAMQANGVYKSTDGGASWRPAGNFPLGTSDGLIKLAIAPTSPNVLFASVADPTSSGLAKMLKTTDGGNTWTVLSNVPNYLGGQGFFDSSLAIDPANANTIYAGDEAINQDPNGNFTGGFIESTDGGTTWTAIDIGGNGSNGPHNDHHAIAFDANGKLLDANDGGLWRLDTATPPSVSWTDLTGDLDVTQFTGIALVPTDPNTAYGGSQDNGTEKFTGSLPWNHIQFGDGGHVRVDFSNPATVYHTFFYGFPGFLERSNDGGNTWVAADNGINPNDNGDFYVPYVMDPSNSSRLVLGTDHVYETKNKGANWIAIANPGVNNFNSLGRPIDALAISPTSPSTIYVTAGGHNFVTTNDGQTWKVIDVPNVTDHFADVKVDPANSQVAYVVRDSFGGSKVYKTANGGTTWTSINGNLPDIPARTLALNPQNGTLFLGTDVGVFASSDGGATWATAGTGLPNVEVSELVAQHF